MIDSSDLLRHAEELLNFDNEEYWRDSAKNAYYAVFHHISELLDKHHIYLMNKDSGTHQLLLKRLKSIDNRYAQVIAKDVDVLRYFRVKCCYQLKHTITKNAALSHLRYCQEVILKLPKLETILEEMKMS